MINKYKLTSNKVGGSLDLEYTDGYLTGLSMDFKRALTNDMYVRLYNGLAFFESDLQRTIDLGFSVSKILPTNKAMALFCELYQKHLGKGKYIATLKDGGMLRTIKIDEPLLLAYFASERFEIKDKHSVGNLVKYHHLVRGDMVSPVKPKGKHPDYWSKKHQDSLSAQEAPEYWNHLRSLGFERRTDRLGNTIEWLKINPLNKAS